MFTRQASEFVNRLIGTGMPRDQATVLHDLVGNCQAEYEHRGPIDLNVDLPAGAEMGALNLSSYYDNGQPGNAINVYAGNVTLGGFEPGQVGTNGQTKLPPGLDFGQADNTLSTFQVYYNSTFGSPDYPGFGEFTVYQDSTFIGDTNIFGDENAIDESELNVYDYATFYGTTVFEGDAEGVLVRVELTSNVSSGTANAKRLVWNGASYVTTGADFTVYDWTSEFGGSVIGDRGFAAWQPDRNVYELIGLEGNVGILAKPDAQTNRQASGTFSVYRGTAGSESDTMQNIASVWNRTGRTLQTDDWCLLFYNGDSWYATLLEGKAKKIVVTYPSALLASDTTKAGCTVVSYFDGRSPGGTVTVNNELGFESDNGATGYAELRDNNEYYLYQSECPTV